MALFYFMVNLSEVVYHLKPYCQDFLGFLVLAGWRVLSRHYQHEELKDFIQSCLNNRTNLVVGQSAGFLFKAFQFLSQDHFHLLHVLLDVCVQVLHKLRLFIHQQDVVEVLVDLKSLPKDLADVWLFVTHSVH